MDPETLAALIRYHDSADDAVLAAAAGLADGQLDQPFDIGPGSLRRTLIHIIGGEATWVQRWQGHAETRWPDESAATPVAQIQAQCAAGRSGRDAFLRARTAEDWNSAVAYRDSRGSIFQATLREMVLQYLVHSVHHRAQAVNILRRLGVRPPEVDLMVSVRRPM